MFTRRQTPAHVFDELKGLADATGLPYNKVLWLHQFPELIKAACSMFGAWGPATASANGTVPAARARLRHGACNLSYPVYWQCSDWCVCVCVCVCIRPQGGPFSSILLCLSITQCRKRPRVCHPDMGRLRQCHDQLLECPVGVCEKVGWATTARARALARRGTVCATFCSMMWTSTAQSGACRVCVCVCVRACACVCVRACVRACG